MMDPIALPSIRQILKCSARSGLCAAACLALGVGTVLTPSDAAAGGRVHYSVGHHYGGHYKHGGYKSSHYYSGRHRGYKLGGYKYGGYKYGGYHGAKYGYGGKHHYGRKHRRGKLSGGEAALIAAGIIGGVILIDQALENSKAPRRAPYHRPYNGYDPYYQDYSYSSDWGIADQERRALAEERRKLAEERRKLFEERRRLENARVRKSAPVGGGATDNDLDDLLLGGEVIAPHQSADPIVSNAYVACASETRMAADAGGLLVAMPGTPGAVAPIAGGAYRITADFTAQQPSGEQVRRTMQCDADDQGILRLEIL